MFAGALNQDFLSHSIEEYHNCTVRNSLGLPVSGQEIYPGPLTCT